MRRAFLLLCPCLALAAEPGDLPPAALVEKALRAYPPVQAAAAEVRAEEAQRDRLEAGPYEFAIKLASQRRRERPLAQNYREHEIGVERPFRLPGKVAKDTEIGAAGVELAQYALGDALHESARLLLGRWFDWLRESATTNVWAAQVELLRHQQGAVEKRVAAGDASRLELLLSGSQLAQAEAQLAQARARRERAAAEFSQHFPTIPLPTQLQPPTPQAIADSPERWRERILEHHHELQMARVASRRSQLAAQRAEADRLPDPTLGLHLSSERDGQERVFGLQISIPLPGGARSAQARAGLAEASAASSREAHALVRAEAEARRTVSLAQGSHAQWLRLDEVAASMEESARLLEKAWRLGEGQFTELQTARRQAIEARLAATQSQIEANEARYRLLLDAHQLWSFLSDDDSAGNP